MTDDPHELTAFLHPGWAPLIRPAPATRPWMDATPESFAYRCLPLNIANAHGWEVLTPVGFSAVWDGGTGVEAVTIVLDPGAAPDLAPVSLFGQGTITFHVQAIIRTPPGWSLWVGGSPNRQKDAIAPLTGIVETDWSPFTFTMNWRFTRPGQRVRFDPGEPFCFLFPLEREAIERFRPAMAALGDDPATAERFAAWSRERDAFHARMQADPPKTPADRWQKHYYRGVDVSGAALTDSHKSKLRLRSFDRSATSHVPAPPADDPPDLQTPVQAAAGPADNAEIARLRRDLAKRDWLLQTLERQRLLAPPTSTIERRRGVGPEEFLERYYAVNRPVILVGEMAGWPALGWTPQVLKDRIGGAEVEYQDRRAGDAHFERDKDAHKVRGPFGAFLDRIAGAAGNDAYLTAYNASANAAALAPLAQDLRPLSKFLKGGADAGMLWIGPAGTLTSLHHDLTNNLIAQVVGRKRFRILPASEVGRVYNDAHVFSAITDIEDPAIDARRFPLMEGARIYDIVLEPGEILFMPLAWWHEVRALTFSVTLTYTDFRWPNDGHQGYPLA